MKIFAKIKEKGLALRKPIEQEVIVAVPDIKEYLVREYERVNNLKLINEGLQQQLEKTKETEMKYDAAMVTLDEYSKRLELAESKIKSLQGTKEFLESRLQGERDKVNSYAIKFTEAALTKEAIQEEIILEFKNNLVEKFNEVKGNLSKAIVAKIINETKFSPTEKGGEKE